MPGHLAVSQLGPSTPALPHNVTPAMPAVLRGEPAAYTGDARLESYGASGGALDVTAPDFHKTSSGNRALRQLRSLPWAVLISAIALAVSIYSTRNATLGMKAAQRAYITYQVGVTNAETVIDSVTKDKDFFMTYQVTVTNVGNTPAESIMPRINVVPDPDRPPLMITFPTLTQFDLGPKESRILTGQALFKHVRHIRKAPGFSTGFTGQIEYKDVFGDSGIKPVCYQLVFENALNGGFCGSVIQQLQIK